MIKNDIHVQIPQLVWITYFFLIAEFTDKTLTVFNWNCSEIPIWVPKIPEINYKSIVYFSIKNSILYTISIYTCQNMKCRQNILVYQ